MSEQGRRPDVKDTPGGIITARAFKYAGSFYDFADAKYPELRAYPPDVARVTLLQAAIIVAALILMERRTKGAGASELHGGVALALPPSVRDRLLPPVQTLSCSLLQRDRSSLKPQEIPSFADLAGQPDATLVKAIGLWLGRAISGKARLEPADETIAGAAGRSAWTSATMIARMLAPKG
ncbi:MAG: hypothetical protein HYV14_11055 [Elusimicrobia bacterium]|nr:hypothetical protein [Elusimicrobiota bacterium]